MFQMHVISHLLDQALKSIEDAIDAIEVGTPVDMIQIDLTRTWELLGEIIGDTVCRKIN